MRFESPLTFVFESREDVVNEILRGSHAHNLRGFECATCKRLHVRVQSNKLTPFSARVRVPADVVLDVDPDWQKWCLSGPVDESSPSCPTCGRPMVPLEG
jgi:endogenous inhibitor of DNA gyrase (YacG/DUF329 family)